jgi:hypothetical protein
MGTLFHDVCDFLGYQIKEDQVSRRLKSGYGSLPHHYREKKDDKDYFFFET